MRKFTITIVLAAAAVSACGQDSAYVARLTLSGYADAYYQYDFDNPASRTRPYFLYSYNKNNRPELNLAYLKTSYNAPGFRANLALAAGTYMTANYSSEPGILGFLYEANAGVKLADRKDLWLDAGVFPSHIGFEGAVGKDCPTLTRSLQADNSPYYESGARLSYASPNSKWYFSLMLLNGWQHIRPVKGNSSPSFGTQVTFRPSGSVTLNSSTFIGNDKPDSTQRMRYFHDLYGIFQLSKVFQLTAGFDAGAEQKGFGLRGFYFWYSPVIILRAVPTVKTAVALRVEYYRDRNGVIIPGPNPVGFEVAGTSLNFDYSIIRHLLLRAEVRDLVSRNKIFEKTDGSVVRNNLSLAVSAAISF